MCGILGTTNTNQSIDLAMKSLSHRGPDQSDTYRNESVKLGHHRLSIIDLSEGGRQPMADHEGVVTVVYNGEIYNYRELKTELIEEGSRFQTESDTEVILEGYKRYGEPFLERLRGMWALALYDRKRKLLLLSRDRYGVKPLYYTLQNGSLYFASEMKAMRQFNISFKPNSDEYYTLFNLGYFIAPQTCFKDVFTVCPGECIRYDLANKKLSSSVLPRDKGASGGKERGEEEIVNNLHDVLLESVKKHYVSDVPVSILFSGGNDSSLIAALSGAAGYSPKAYHLSIEGSVDTEYAEKIAKHLNLKTESITMTREELTNQYNAIWDVLDIPFADISVIPTSLIYKKINGNSKVVLSGEAGDELFGGYRPHERMARLNNIAKNNSISSLIDSFYGSSSGSFSMRNPVLGRLRNAYLDNVANDVVGTFLSAVKNFDYPLDQKKLRNRLFELYQSSPYKDSSPNLFFDRFMYLPDDLLYKNDIASMASSVEARVPFVDSEVFRHVLNDVPGDMALSPEYKKKYLLRKVLLKYLPDELVNRKKSGFGFSFSKYNVPQFEDDLSKALEFHHKNADMFGMGRNRNLFQASLKDIYLKKYSRFAFAIVSSWKVFK